MKTKSTLLAAGALLTALTLTACGGASEEPSAKGDAKPSASAGKAADKAGTDDATADEGAADKASTEKSPPAEAGGMSAGERDAFLQGLEIAGLKPKGVSDDKLVASVDGVCDAQKKGEDALVAEEGKVKEELKVSDAEAAGIVGAASSTC